MPRPKTKEELLSLGQKNYQKLQDLIDSYSSDQIDKVFPPGTLNRNIRDAIGHLHHWHLLVLKWYKIGMNGEKPSMPEEGYTWKTTPDLNRVILAKYESYSLTKVKALLAESHAKVRALIDSHSHEELFEKKRYKWTGSTSLGAYLISCTSSHYDWALKLIKRCMK